MGSDSIVTKIVPIRFDDGTRMYIEAIADENAMAQRQLAGGVEDSFKAIVSAIKNIAQQVKGAVADASPDHLELEFGIDVKVESNGLVALLVSGSAAANLRVTLKWARP